MDYLSAGQLISRKIYDDKGNLIEKIMDGQGLYGLFGMALWRDSVLAVANVGLDFDDNFGDWFSQNSFSRDGLNFKRDMGYDLCEIYGSDGSITVKPQYPLTVDSKGLMRNTPEEIEKHCDGIKGMYLFQNADRVIWDKLLTLKKCFNFKLMWEIDEDDCVLDNRDKIVNTIKNVDFFSVTVAGSQSFLDIKDEAEIVEFYRQTKTPTLLYKEGSGIYIIMNEQSIFCEDVKTETVDKTGNKTSATAAALVAYCEGADPLMIGAIALITAGINCESSGVIFDVSPQLNRRASDMVNDYIAKKQ